MPHGRDGGGSSLGTSSRRRRDPRLLQDQTPGGGGGHHTCSSLSTPTVYVCVCLYVCVCTDTTITTYESCCPHDQTSGRNNQTAHTTKHRGDTRSHPLTVLSLPMSCTFSALRGCWPGETLFSLSPPNTNSPSPIGTETGITALCEGLMVGVACGQRARQTGHRTSSFFLFCSAAPRGNRL